MKKKYTWLKVVAILAGISAIAVAVALFLKKKGKKIKEELEFDEDLYLDTEDDFSDDIMDGDATIAPEDMDDDMMPEESEDSITADLDDIEVTEVEDAEEK